MSFRGRYQLTPKKKSAFDRINVLSALFFILFLLIIWRLFNLQILQHKDYQALALGQHLIEKELLPERGEIFAHDGIANDKLYPVALNKKYYWLYAVPKEVADKKEELAKKITEFFCQDKEQLLDSEQEIEQLLVLDKDELKTQLETLIADQESCTQAEERLFETLADDDDPFVPIKRHIDDQTKAEVEKLGFSGLHFTEEFYRYYPEKNIGSHIIGFYGFAGEQLKGQYGLEGYFEDQLKGRIGSLKAEKDVSGHWITIADRLLTPAVDGDDIVLTIDRNIQFFACQKLNQAVLKHGADGGSVIILNPKTGAILAMCGAPDFDPNKYNEVENLEVFINPATFYIYEPGSIFKAFTMAAGLDLGLVSPNSTYDDSGEVKIGKYTIKNSDEKAHGTQTMTNVLEQSLNTGAIYVARLVGSDHLRDYVQRFGFGSDYGLQLASEAGGDISSLNKDSEIYLATASFGQGISATPLQIVAAYQPLANQGKLMRPYIVDEIKKSDGTSVKTQPQEIRQAIQSKTATTLGAMLVAVVENGHGQRAGVKGYYVAGKTGTAQVPKDNGAGYDPYKNIGSFAGFAPVDNPKFVMLTKIDVPRDVDWAESSAAPLFGEIAQFLLNYYQVPPERSD